MKPYATITLALLFAAGGASAGSTLHFVEHADTDSVTDLGAKGDSPGDLLTFANPVFDAANKTKVGSDQGFCVRIVGGKAWECWWTLVLTEGQLTVEGPFVDGANSVLAVTGGTGKYAGARGQMKLHSRNDQATEFDFVYELK